MSAPSGGRARALRDRASRSAGRVPAGPSSDLPLSRGLLSVAVRESGFSDLALARSALARHAACESTRRAGRDITKGYVSWGRGNIRGRRPLPSAPSRGLPVSWRLRVWPLPARAAACASACSGPAPKPQSISSPASTLAPRARSARCARVLTTRPPRGPRSGWWAECALRFAPHAHCRLRASDARRSAREKRGKGKKKETSGEVGRTGFEPEEKAAALSSLAPTHPLAARGYTPRRAIPSAVVQSRLTNAAG